MANEPRPRVAVIGGFYELDTKGDLGQQARTYAISLGRALAENGFALVVYFSNDNSLEPHVVQGFVSALHSGESSPCIYVRYSDKQRGEVRFKEQDTHPNLFHEKPFPGSNWEAPFYRSLAERDSLDAVLLMAGGKSTLNAGQVAIGRGLPLLAIDMFRGAAQDLYTELALRITGYPSSRSSTPSQMVGWLRDQHLKEIEVLRQQQDREHQFTNMTSQLARMTSQKRGATWFGIVMVALLVTLGLGLVGVHNPRWFVATMGAVLVSAGAAGALVRSLTTATITQDLKITCLLGVVAGLVVGLAYLIPQLIGAPHLLKPTAAEVLETDRIQLLSVALVAFTAGIGFDTVFRRIQQEADKVAVTVSR